MSGSAGLSCGESIASVSHEQKVVELISSKLIDFARLSGIYLAHRRPEMDTVLP